MVFKEGNSKKQSIDFTKIINLVPGTLVYRGLKSEPFSIEYFEYNELDHQVKVFSSFKTFEAFLTAHDSMKNSVKWVNVTGINHVEEIKQLGAYFGIIQLLLEEILSINKHSMYKSTETYLFNDVQMLYVENHVIKNENVSIYKNDQYIITFQERKGDVFESIRERIIQDYGTIRSSNQGYTYFSLLDALIDNYLHVMTHINMDIEEMEETVTNLDLLEVSTIHRIRKQLMLIKFSTNPIDKLIQQLLLDEKILGAENKDYLESLSDHIKDVQSELLAQKETVAGLFENYMLSNSNDMNRIMTTLTIFSAIFIPLSFMAGVFGMNFDYIPGLNNGYGFFYFIVGCLVTAFSMVTFFKLKNWF